MAEKPKLVPPDQTPPDELQEMARTVPPLIAEFLTRFEALSPAVQSQFTDKFLKWNEQGLTDLKDMGDVFAKIHSGIALTSEEVSGLTGPMADLEDFRSGLRDFLSVETMTPETRTEFTALLGLIERAVAIVGDEQSYGHIRFWVSATRDKLDGTGLHGPTP